MLLSPTAGSLLWDDKVDRIESGREEDVEARVASPPPPPTTTTGDGERTEEERKEDGGVTMGRTRGVAEEGERRAS